MTDLKAIFHSYFKGNNFISGPIFNIDVLRAGRFLKFVNHVNFTYDSDIFNSALSKFTHAYNLKGDFFITSEMPLENNVHIRNDFDPWLINTQIEQQNEVVKYVPSFIFDSLEMWCIYFDNDADVFISWCNEKIAGIFEKYFLIENSDFHHEKDDSAFLNLAAARLTGPSKLGEKELKTSIKNSNPILFGDVV